MTSEIVVYYFPLLFGLFSLFPTPAVIDLTNTKTMICEYKSVCVLINAIIYDVTCTLYACYDFLFNGIQCLDFIQWTVRHNFDSADDSALVLLAESFPL